MDIAVVSACRSAIGSFMGSISSMPAHNISAQLIKHTLKQTAVAPEEISEVIIGQVLNGGCGQNPARQAAINAGLPHAVPAWMVNKVCGSGLTSIMLGCNALKLGQASIILAGGQENMSLSGHVAYLRHGQKMGKLAIEDMMLKDGLTDAFSQLHMGISAENIAERFKISRQAQDEFALLSQSKANTAVQQGRFKDEIIPIVVPSRTGDVIFDKDEGIRSNTTIEVLSKLKAAFKNDGTVTAGNASSINDGAAILMLMSVKEAQRRQLKIIARIASYATVGVDPEIMGIGPIPAARKALEMAGWKIADLDLIESNEAFAVQSIYVNQEMGWDVSKVNVNGGAIALGHPIGASGARILVTLLHEMQKRNANKGISALCVGGGMGVALCVQRD